MDINEILIVIIYSKYTNVTYQFRKSYRNISKINKKELIIKHCNKWYWYGYTLQKAIKNGGFIFGSNNINELYHGLNNMFIFDSFIFNINQPLSTTNELEINCKEFY